VLNPILFQSYKITKELGSSPIEAQISVPGYICLRNLAMLFPFPPGFSSLL